MRMEDWFLPIAKDINLFAQLWSFFFSFHQKNRDAKALWQTIEVALYYKVPNEIILKLDMAKKTFYKDIWLY